MIRQYVFCPRIPFYHWVMGWRVAMPVWVAQGAAHHERQAMLQRRRNLSRFGLDRGTVRYDVQLADERLALHGICDAVIDTGEELVPLDFKLHAKKMRRGHALQLCAYAMLLEAQEGRPARRGFVLAGDRGRTWGVEMTPALRQQVRDITIALLQMAESARKPESSATVAQCTQCEYLHGCADRD